MAEPEFTPTNPDAQIRAFVSLTGKIHVEGGTQSWGVNPACTGQYTKGSVAMVARKEITCLKCQQSLLDAN